MKEFYMIKLVVGFDSKEAIAYHTFCQSVLENSSKPVSFTPLAIDTLPEYNESHNDGSNDFIYTRFLTPWLFGFKDWAIYADGDMVCLADIAELWSLKDSTKAVHVVKHDYKSKASKKYLGNTNQNYPRKNWSSVILWNCGHPMNKILTPNFVASKSGSYLHRFSWLEDRDIGEIPLKWNWLAEEYDAIDDAKIIHYTLGTPCFADYKLTSMSNYWHQCYKRTNRGLDD